jgi:hypothetical protein
MVVAIDPFWIIDAPAPSGVEKEESGFANTCVESTGRFGMEFGYHVTLVKDATAAFSWKKCTRPS